MKEKQPIRWGILSAGKIAGSFASALGEANNGVIIAVAARELERVKAVC